MASPIAPSRDLLFGLLALQNGLINQVQLVAAFQAWTLDKARALADHLIALGHLNGAQKAVVEAMADLHVAKHGDVERSLAAISAGRSTHESLARLGDPDIEGTLAHVRPRSIQQDGEADADRTALYSVGSATSDGLRFRVLRPHARGGLGAVFVALDRELHREVALKQILDQHADDPVSRARFLLEAEVTGGLEHPGIVPVYGLGAYPDGRPYYAMRFIRGDSLKQAIERFHGDEALKKDSGRRSLKLRKLLRRFLDVCNAVGYAHSRGVLHRDIKPGNVIVGKHGETLVVDWGLAKPMGRVEPGAQAGERTLVPSSASGSAETLPGSALGTPAYMSPEQAEGDLDRLGPRSDVYSLGATLYCLLAGVPPFEGDIADVLRAVREGTFQAPCQVEPSIDKALEAICLKAMARRPEDRYEAPRLLAEDIERWMADEPVSAWREPWTRTLARWLARNRTGVAAAAAAVLVALAGLGAVAGVEARANGRLSQANLALAEANAQVKAVNEELKLANAREADRFNLALESIRLFHGEVSSDFLMKEKPFQALRTKLLRGAAEFYTKLEGRLKDQADPTSRAALAAAYEDLGIITGYIGESSDAIATKRKALAIRRELATRSEAGVEDRIALVRNLLSTSLTLLVLGNRSEALAARDEALGLAEAANSAEPSSASARLVLAEALDAVGRSLSRERGRLGEALEKDERARAIMRDLVSSDPGNRDFRYQLALYEGNCALFLDWLGRSDESVTTGLRAIALFEEVGAPANPNWADEMAKVRNNLARAWISLGRQDRALDELGRCLALWRATSDAVPNSIVLRNNLAFGLCSRGDLFEQMGRLEEAIDAFSQGRDLFRKLRAEDPSWRPGSLSLRDALQQLGLIMLAKGDQTGAVNTFQEELAYAEQWAGRNALKPNERLMVAGAHRDIGKALLAAGRPSEALDHLRKAEAIDGAPGKDKPNAPLAPARLADDLSLIGRALHDLGDIAGAAAATQRAIGQFVGVQSLASPDLYAFACARTTLSGLAGRAGSGVTPDEGRAEADKAMALLARAVDEGERYPDRIRNEPALQPLRDRPDFQLLMLDLAFPADPFSKVTEADP